MIDLFLSKKLSDKAKVLAYIIVTIDLSYVTVSQLEELTGIPKRTIRLHLTQLVAANVISCEKLDGNLSVFKVVKSESTEMCTFDSVVPLKVPKCVLSPLSHVDDVQSNYPSGKVTACNLSLINNDLFTNWDE